MRNVVADLDVADVAAALASAGSCGIGDVRAEPLKARQKQCFRCLAFGHLAGQCTGADVKNICYRCGDGGHHAATCLAEPKCPLCARLGQPSNHGMGGAKCASIPVKGRRKRIVEVPPASGIEAGPSQLPPLVDEESTSEPEEVQEMETFPEVSARGSKKRKPTDPPAKEKAQQAPSVGGSSTKTPPAKKKSSGAKATGASIDAQPYRHIRRPSTKVEAWPYRYIRQPSTIVDARPQEVNKVKHLA
ncbi:uncharacterized protein LOC109861012 [Pseudomyrmex gracilis]|uniref:uncharacterized protein LOC109861012 n=1 Tax=Pseudomyrmex gracilis TaxID=219809 RepID=UPI000994D724|nr:uncharacterized protein LOC109861012 [Pseudomyrmex gracilis]